MEKKKLLRLLTIISVIISNLVVICFAEDNPNANWLEELNTNVQSMSIEAIKEVMNRPDFDSNKREQVLKPRPALQIFVSSSMPSRLLKAYASEAKLYDGVLVFRGLPGGSIHKLTDLIMEISDENSAQMAIDDEAFAAFGMQVVPAIVLSTPAPIFSSESLSEKFDKVAGTVTIKSALELFSKNGDMSVEARELLSNQIGGKR